MDAVFRIIGIIVCGLGGGLLCVAIVGFLGWLVCCAWIAFSNKFRAVCKVESLIFEYHYSIPTWPPGDGGPGYRGHELEIDVFYGGGGGNAEG